MNFFILTAAALTACASAKTWPWPKKTCNAIVIGAQGAQQSYVTGALAVLAATGTKYDVVVSTSSSILAAQAAVTSSTPEWVASAAVAMLKVTADQVYTEWPKGEVDGIENQGGLYNATVSETLYRGILNRARPRRAPKVVAVAVSLTTTLQVPLEVTASNVGDSVNALRASAADPTTFEAVQVGKDRFVSGEVRGQLDVYEAVAQCRMLGFKDKDMTVDVVYTGASKLEAKDVANDTSLVVMARGDEIKAYIAAQSDRLYAQWTYPAVNWRYDVSPSAALTFNTTYYGLDAYLNMSKLGAKDALDSIKKVKAAVECDTARDAPTCSKDQDCKVWAAKACLKGAAIARQGRCLIGTDEVDGQCSFDATEIAKHRAAHVTLTEKDGICLGSAFSGGGDYGAYEAGVVKGLTSVGGCASTSERCPFSWEVAAGVSVGSIVSAGLAKFPIGLEAHAADFMVATAINGTGDSLLKEWPEKEGEGCCLNRGLNFESGMLDPTGLEALLHRSFPDTPLPQDKSGYRHHTFLATNMGTGEGKVWSFQGSVGTQGFIDRLRSSAAIQGIFPMVHIDGEYYGDGGAVATIDAFAAIQKCRSLGYSDANIRIDTISIAGYKQVVLSAAEAFALDADEIASRVAQIQTIDNFMSVIQDVRDAEPRMFRINQYPQDKLPGDGLNFNGPEMQEMVTIGIADGVATAKSLLANDAAADGAMPKSCTYETTTVACGSDKDCFNWAVEKCNGMLSATTCHHTERTCVFTQ